MSPHTRSVQFFKLFALAVTTIKYRSVINHKLLKDTQKMYVLVGNKIVKIA